MGCKRVMKCYREVENRERKKPTYRIENRTKLSQNRIKVMRVKTSNALCYTERIRKCIINSNNKHSATCINPNYFIQHEIIQCFSMLFVVDGICASFVSDTYGQSKVCSPNRNLLQKSFCSVKYVDRFILINTHESNYFSTMLAH